MWDFGSFGSISFDLKFLSAVLSIVLIDLILAGDNAVVIALAVRSLPRKQRIWGIIFGSGAAVLLRVVLTFFAAQLLRIAFLKLAGGILITWVAVKLFMQGTEEKKIGEAANLWQAVRLIVFADLVMSTDNVLAVAGASHGNVFLLLFGLALSIPFVVGTSTLLSMLMDKYPVIVYHRFGRSGQGRWRHDHHGPLGAPRAPAPEVRRVRRHGLVRRRGHRGGETPGPVEAEQGGELARGGGAAPGGSGNGPEGGENDMAIVTISRESGTGGEAIGKAVAGKLGYEYLDKTAIFRDLEEHGKQWAEWGKEMDEHSARPSGDGSTGRSPASWRWRRTTSFSML